MVPEVQYYFWYGGTLCSASLERTGVSDDKYTKGEDDLVLRCFWYNSEPLKKFIRQCREHTKSCKSETTDVHNWTRRDKQVTWMYPPTTKPRRPMSTIDLDGGVKDILVQDAEKYFNPSAKKWYADRGIPYRRGWLFHGPWGTGKSSFAMALAGHLNLDIFVCDMSVGDMTGEELIELLTKVANCIVLIEDIDSAGIKREKMIKDSKKSKDKNKDKKKNKGISLSTLLNAIDGASATEGRLLIMTSNAPDTLDPALLRPGRIDRQVFFGPIARDTIKKIFIRLYTPISQEETTNNGNAGEKPSVSPRSWENPEKLQALAEEFAQQIPDGKITPPEIQGFLLMHAEDPFKAIEQAAQWVKDVLAAKELKAGVVREGVKTPDSPDSSSELPVTRASSECAKRASEPSKSDNSDSESDSDSD